MIIELVKKNNQYFIMVLGYKIPLTTKQQYKIESILHQPKDEENDED